MKIYDISLQIHPDMIRYPGDPAFSVSPYKAIDKGDSSNVSTYCLGSHMGTHVDSPHHMLGNGDTLDRIPLEKFIAKARVYKVKQTPVLDESVLSSLDFSGISYALFNTDNSESLHDSNRFDKNFVYFDQTGARFLVAQRIEGVGIDYLSVDKFHSANHPAHLAFMRGGVIIIEGVDLFEVPPGDYTIFIGALKVKAADGSPARILLVSETE